MPKFVQRQGIFFDVILEICWDLSNVFTLNIRLKSVDLSRHVHYMLDIGANMTSEHFGLFVKSPESNVSVNGV